MATGCPSGQAVRTAGAAVQGLVLAWRRSSYGCSALAEPMHSDGEGQSLLRQECVPAGAAPAIKAADASSAIIEDKGSR